MIPAVGENRAQIERTAAADPFALHGVCAYRITEFIATKTSDALAPHRQ